MLRKAIPVIITLLAGSGVAGVLGYFGNTTLGLIINSASIIVAVLLAVYYFYSEKKPNEDQGVRQYIKKLETRQKLMRFAAIIVLPVIVFTVMIIWASNLSFNITHNPILSSPQFEGKSITNDENNMIATGTITFAVQNRGNNSAFKTSSIICYASDATPTNIQKGLTAVSPNPLKPQDYLLYYLNIKMPFWMDNGERSIISPNYYIYYKVGCSNTANRKLDYEEYWLMFDFNSDKPTIPELKPDEVAKWKPFVYDYYANLNNK